jgi:hypothetical protein
MQKNILNFIIVASIFAIVIALSKDYFFKNETSKVTTNNPTPIPTLTSSISPASADLVTCENPYFTYKEGTSWKYKIQDGKDISYFTTKIIKNNGSSVSLQTTTDDNKVSTSTMYCRKDGLYGLPIPILSLLTKNASGSMGSMLGMLKLDDNLRLLPQESEIKLHNTWTTNLPINMSLPIKIPLGISLENTVDGISTQTFSSVGQIKTAHIKSVLDLQGLEGMLPTTQKAASSSAGETNILSYTLGEKIGIASLEIGIDTSSINVSLVQFTP